MDGWTDGQQAQGASADTQAGAGLWGLQTEGPWQSIPAGKARSRLHHGDEGLWNRKSSALPVLREDSNLLEAGNALLLISNLP